LTTYPLDSYAKPDIEANYQVSHSYPTDTLLEIAVLPLDSYAKPDSWLQYQVSHSYPTVIRC
ncbi:hypothetical protein PS021_24685, partial [Shigella sonnei]|nr:hypothetical protein [Shigella sonnei]